MNITVIQATSYKYMSITDSVEPFAEIFPSPINIACLVHNVF